MAITAEGMRSRYLAAIADISQTSDPAAASATSDQILLALFAAVVDEIHDNARAVGNDSDGDSHNLEIL